MKTIEELAKRIFVDHLVTPAEAIAPGDWLTFINDGSGLWVCERSFEVDRLDDDIIYLKMNGGVMF